MLKYATITPIPYLDTLKCWNNFMKSISYFDLAINILLPEKIL